MTKAQRKLLEDLREVIEGHNLCLHVPMLRPLLRRIKTHLK